MTCPDYYYLTHFWCNYRWYSVEEPLRNRAPRIILSDVVHWATYFTSSNNVSWAMNKWNNTVHTLTRDRKEEESYIYIYIYIHTHTNSHTHTHKHTHPSINNYSILSIMKLDTLYSLHLGCVIIYECHMWRVEELITQWIRFRCSVCCA